RDLFGTVRYEQGPNGRCRSVDLEPTYQLLATNESVLVGAVANDGVCGTTSLDAKADYDLGFGAPTKVTDIHGETTVAEYDGFGRIVSLSKPDPDEPRKTSPLPSLKVEYLLTGNAVSQPYSLLHVQTQDGSAPNIDSYRHSWAYVDGMGRTIVTLEQADVVDD